MEEESHPELAAMESARQRVGDFLGLFRCEKGNIAYLLKIHERKRFADVLTRRDRTPERPGVLVHRHVFWRERREKEEGRSSSSSLYREGLMSITGGRESSGWRVNEASNASRERTKIFFCAIVGEGGGAGGGDRLGDNKSHVRRLFLGKKEKNSSLQSIGARSTDRNEIEVELFLPT